MKICHITVAHNRYDTRIFKREATTMSQFGCDVVIICADGKLDEVKNGVTIKSYTRAPLSKKQRFSLLIKNTSFVKYLISQKADIYQFHDLELIEVGRKLKNKKQKVVFDSHENWLDIIPDYFPSFLRGFISKSFIPYYYRKVVSSFDAVFSVSPNMIERLNKYNSRTYLVPNFPTIQNLNHINSSKEDFIIYQGTVYTFSNQREIISAISNIDAVFKYKIIGKISDEYKTELISQDSTNKVEFISWKEKEELDTIMSKAICGLVLLDYCNVCCGKEGQLGSNKIFEYMLNGLPVICTDFELWKTMIIDQYKCGICVEPNNIKQIEEAIRWMLSNRDEAAEMGFRGRKAILNEFNWEKYESLLFNYYSSL